MFRFVADLGLDRDSPAQAETIASFLEDHDVCTAAAHVVESMRLSGIFGETDGGQLYVEPILAAAFTATLAD